MCYELTSVVLIAIYTALLQSCSSLIHSYKHVYTCPLVHAYSQVISVSKMWSYFLIQNLPCILAMQL
jgi:hypothetical protein